jgi:hypothetical protein
LSGSGGGALTGITARLASDLSNLKKGFHLKWMEYGLKEAVLVRGNSKDENLK